MSGDSQLNPKTGRWEPSVPLPFYNGLLWWPLLLRFGCECGKTFWWERSYRQHWLEAHASASDWVR